MSARLTVSARLVCCICISTELVKFRTKCQLTFYLSSGKVILFSLLFALKDYIVLLKVGLVVLEHTKIKTI